MRCHRHGCASRTHGGTGARYGKRIAWPVPHEAPGDEGKYTPRRRPEVTPATEIQKASHVRAPSSSYRLPQRRCAYGSGLRRTSSSLDFAANTTRVPQRHALVVPAPLRQQCALRRPSRGHTADGKQNGRYSPPEGRSVPSCGCFGGPYSHPNRTERPSQGCRCCSFFNAQFPLVP